MGLFAHIFSRDFSEERIRSLGWIFILVIIGREGSMMENQFIRYNDALYTVNSFAGLKCYQKVKEVLAEFDVKLKEEMANDDSSSELNPSNPEPKRQNIWESGVKVNLLV
jgi:hypothetical protein